MNESNSQTEMPKDQRRFSQEQYDMLKRCSDKKDMTEWNEWRKEHPDKDILLQGGDFCGWYMEGALLNRGEFKSRDGKNYNFNCEVHLSSALFRNAKLNNVVFHNARLQNTKFGKAYLEESVFQGSHLEGANFYKARLCGANFKWVIFDKETSFIEIEIDHNTDFSCTGLNGIRIEPGTKQLLEYNIRRMNWEEWYKEHSWLKWLVKPFWWISDYGISTKRIIYTFFGLAFLFALLYRLFPGFVRVYGKVGDIRGFWHTLYFSVVTMTTLGFGDIAANPDSWVGQTLLMIQVILGYVLLGALVTRFAVLFTAGGPAGKFEDEKEKEDEKK
jgi:hypothetical protein